jgi:hypothetical protein
MNRLFATFEPFKDIEIRENDDAGCHQWVGVNFPESTSPCKVREKDCQDNLFWAQFRPSSPG